MSNLQDQTFSYVKWVPEGRAIRMDELPDGELSDALAFLKTMERNAAEGTQPWTFFECDVSNPIAFQIFSLWRCGKAEIASAVCIQNGQTFYLAKPI